ncbi:MAG: hypothetical protein KAS32_12335 [Candidatus Peribacteraceae bacterium]|nr:hypothetical protein [Candidatus Peribacteraceae bacterium]
MATPLGLDKTYFKNTISLPKSDYDNIESFMTQFEKEVLTYLLGYELYTLMIAGKAEAPYKNLVEGVEYSIEHSGQTRKVKWNGLKNSDLISLIAYYTYIEYIRDGVTSTQQNGEVLSVQENSKGANIFAKIMSAQTRFEELYGYEYQDELIPSAYNFLTEHEDLYPTWIFTSLKGNINSHDL